MTKNNKPSVQYRDQASAWRRILPLAVLGILALAVVGFFMLRGGEEESAEIPDLGPFALPATIGEGTATRARLVSYCDFTNAQCRAWHKNGFTDLLTDQFGDDLTYTFRFFPTDENGMRAAAASMCAADQEQFWPFHDYLFEEAADADYSAENLKQYAATLGLDTALFNQCIEFDKYSDYVASDIDVGAQAGVTAAPAFLINGVLLESTDPFQVLGVVGDVVRGQ